MRMEIIVSQINSYPIKSLAGISLSSAVVEERGLQHDRRWMLVDERNQFITQRKLAKMALIRPELTESGLVVQTRGMPPLSVPFRPENQECILVTVWDDTCPAIEVSQEANAWFSKALQMPCKLVYMPDDSVRPVDPRYAVEDECVSFADGYPFLLISEASLADLNSRLETPVPMNRFRPNIVVRGTEPFAEDTWRTIQIGETTFYVVKPCARCVVTTIDQQTAQKSKEPLKTLATYRSAGSKVMFGQNMVYGRKGNHIRVGDAMRVVEQK